MKWFWSWKDLTTPREKIYCGESFPNRLFRIRRTIRAIRERRKT